MTNEAFTEAVIRMTPTLYRIARGQLMIEADRQDAVQETEYQTVCYRFRQRA